MFSVAAGLFSPISLYRLYGLEGFLNNIGLGFMVTAAVISTFFFVFFLLENGLVVFLFRAATESIFEENIDFLFCLVVCEVFLPDLRDEWKLIEDSP